MDVPTSEVELSVVVPVLNGVGTLAELHGRLSATLEQCCQSHEIVIVDDGSRDGTWQLVGELTHRDPSMRGLRLARNSGHAAAVAAGFSVSRGAIVAMIDVDLETFPEDMVLLVDAVRGGADLASGRRTTSRIWYRELGSRAFNAHTRRSGIDLRDIGCGMNAMRRLVAEEYVASGAQPRSLVKPLLVSFSPRTVEIDVRSVRPEGSHLGMGDLMTFWLEFDALRRRPPWAWFAALGVVGVLAGALQLVLGLAGVPLSPSLRWSFQGVATMLLGVLLCGLGVLAGLLLKRLQTLGTPWFRIVETVGVDGPDMGSGG